MLLETQDMVLQLLKKLDNPLTRRSAEDDTVTIMVQPLDAAVTTVRPAVQSMTASPKTTPYPQVSLGHWLEDSLVIKQERETCLQQLLVLWLVLLVAARLLRSMRGPKIDLGIVIGIVIRIVIGNEIGTEIGLGSVDNDPMTAQPEQRRKWREAPNDGMND
jgi:hypothetical protein